MTKRTVTWQKTVELRNVLTVIPLQNFFQSTLGSPECCGDSLSPDNTGGWFLLKLCGGVHAGENEREMNNGMKRKYFSGFWKKGEA